MTRRTIEGIYLGVSMATGIVAIIFAFENVLTLHIGIALTVFAFGYVVIVLTVMNLRQ